MNLSDFSPEAQRIEHLMRARQEVLAAMSPPPRVNYVDGYLGAIYESLVTAITMLTYEPQPEPMAQQASPNEPVTPPAPAHIYAAYVCSNCKGKFTGSSRNGRCNACATYLYQNGVERPARLFLRNKPASPKSIRAAAPTKRPSVPGRNHQNFTEEQVREIRREATTPAAIRAIAVRYGVSYPAIKYIADGKSYTWVK